MLYTRYKIVVDDKRRDRHTHTHMCAKRERRRKKKTQSRSLLAFALVYSSISMNAFQFNCVLYVLRVLQKHVLVYHLIKKTGSTLIIFLWIYFTGITIFMSYLYIGRVLYFVCYVVCSRRRSIQNAHVLFSFSRLVDFLPGFSSICMNELIKIESIAHFKTDNCEYEIAWNDHIVWNHSCLINQICLNLSI